MSWLFKTNSRIIFNRKNVMQLVQKFQNILFYSTKDFDDEHEKYRKYFPYSTQEKQKKSDELQISKITLDDYAEAAGRMNEFFWDNTLVKAFNVEKSNANKRVVYNMWLNHLNENLSLKSFYKNDPNKINGIIINSPHVQYHELTELLDLADMAETKELQNYFLALADIVKKPKIYSEYAKIMEINGIGVDHDERRHGIAKRLLNASIYLGKENGFTRIRADCTNCSQAESLFSNDWRPILKIPFHKYNDINADMGNDSVQIYEKRLKLSNFD